MNMSSTVTLFKELGRETQASQMLQHYIGARGAEPQLFNLRHYPFSVSDPDVIQAFNDKYATFKREASPREILLRISDTNSWSSEDINTLARLSADEYYKLFKAAKADLLKIINACLMFDSMADATADYREVVSRAKQALTRIGGESRINARRVKTYLRG